MNQLITRYMSGEYDKVWKEIENTDIHHLDIIHADDIRAVLQETFSRVAYNLQIIYKALTDIGYLFASDHPLVAPDSNTGARLTKIQEAVSSFGHIPASLKYFYEIVGSCDFTWNAYASSPIWEYSDPLQISGLQELSEYVSDGDWAEYMEELKAETPDMVPYVELSADYYHKDNVSGGQAYSIAINPYPSVDSKFLFEERNTTFVNYLRISINNCGFSRINKVPRVESLDNFLKTVKPQLKPF